MSKLLSKFLQNILFPASVMIVSKLAGIYFAIKFFNLDFFIANQQEGRFSLQIYFTNQADTLLANSIANFSMLFFIGAFSLYYLIKYRLSLLATYNPKTLVKLNNLNLLTWVNTRGNTFLKVFIWIMFFWVASIIIIAETLAQNSFLWIGLLSFVTGIVFIWILIRTFEIESEIIYPHSKTSKLY